MFKKSLKLDELNRDQASSNFTEDGMYACCRRMLRTIKCNVIHSHLLGNLGAFECLLNLYFSQNPYYKLISYLIERYKNY
jgi:hypothetical protein